MGLHNPLVSIIIPVKNGEKYIFQAINSALAQTYKNIEIIVVNDASTDKTKEIIENLMKKSKNVRLINHKESKFRSGALNTGIRKSKGKYVSFLDADDIYFPDKTGFQVKFLEEHPDVDMVYGGAVVFSEKGIKGKTKILESKDLREKLRKASEFSLKKLMNEKHAVFASGKEDPGIIAGCSVMIRKEVFENLKFDESLKTIQDYDFWYQMIGAGYKIKHINKYFYKYRIHENQITKDSIQKAKSKKKIFEKIKNLSYFKKSGDLFEKFIQKKIKFHPARKEKKYPVEFLYEDKTLICFLTPPKNNDESDLLVIPKKHYEFIENVPAKILSSLIEFSAKVAGVLRKEYGGANIILNNGKLAEQWIPHVHFHIVPKKKNKTKTGLLGTNPWKKLSVKKFKEISKKLSRKLKT